MPAHGHTQHAHAVAIPGADGNSATFVDRIGRNRTVYKTRKGWQVFRAGETLPHSLSLGVGPIIGAKIKARRLALGMELAELCEAAGLTATTPKSRMWEIENAIRGHGVRIGTLYAIAHALKCDPRDLMPTIGEALEAGGVAAETKTVLSFKRPVKPAVA